MPRTTLLAALAVAATLLAGAADALYVMTPLRISPQDSEGLVGDALAFVVEPSPDSNRSMAGETVTLRYTWNAREGEEAPPDEPAAEAEERSADAQSIELDGKGQASFTWTIPAEVDDRNVMLTLVDAAGEPVAFAYLRVGDAPHQARIMAGPGGGEPIEAQPEPMVEGDARQETPGAPLAFVAALGAAVALLRRR